jgi:uncharacterized protein YecE (DUF72 family)
VVKIKLKHIVNIATNPGAIFLLEVCKKFSQMKVGIVRIGTSGVVLPGPKTTFPEAFQSGTRLQYYSALFNTLEINSTFYKIPRPSTFLKWSTEVPDNFKFTIKLWKGITHAKKLLHNIDDIVTFMRAANQLGNKKGCLLIQFPASINFEYFVEVERILQRLNEINSDGQWNLCLEFRHISWYEEITYTMLNEYKTSLVFHDIPVSKTPSSNQATDIIYLRFHGPKGDYRGNYTDEFIQDYAEKINEWTKEGKDVYVYFNNTIGSALQNAQLLQRLVH